MIDPEGPLIYILIFTLLILSAFVAGCETAYSSCNKIRMVVLADDNNKRAKLVLKILEHFDRTIITTLIAINICHVVLSVLSTTLFVMLINEVTGSLLSTIITTIVVFFFAEILPKNIATFNADKWALFFSPFMYFLILILWPFSFIFNTILKGTQKAFKLEENEETFDEDDFTDIVEQVEDEGILDENESDIIQAAIDFGDIKVKEILTPVEKMVAIDINKCNIKYIDSLLNECTYSRIPVYEGNIDNIIGVLFVRTYLKNRLTKKRFSIRNILTKAYTVDPSQMIDEIFYKMQENKAQIGIVKDKEKTLGMVTLKDILEELVDDIDDSEDEKRGIK